MISYIIAIIIVLAGVLLIVYSATKIVECGNNQKTVCHAVKSEREDVNVTAHKIASALRSKKKPPIDNEHYYKTTYEYTDAFGEKKRFIDEERTPYQIPEGVEKEFVIQNSVNGKVEYENRDKYKGYLKTGLMYIGLGLLVFIMNYLS